MNTKLRVCDRKTAAKLGSLSVKWAVISIKNPGAKEVVFNCPNLVGALHLTFHDEIKPNDAYVMFDEAMATETWDFVKKHWDEVDIVLVHCHMGLCRSPAIAAAVAKALEGDDKLWFKIKSPNRHVYRTMLQVAHERGLV